MRKSRISFSINKKQGKNEGGSDSTMTEPLHSANQQSNLKPSSYFACRFCCKRFKSEKTYETHSKTKKHAKAVKAGRESELTKTRTCAGCRQSFDTRLQLTQHCKKSSHMPLAQKTSLRNPVYGKPYTDAEQEDPFVSIKYYSPYYCEVCDLDCVSDVHYQDHVKSTRHEKAVEKRAEQGKGVLVDLDTQEVDTSDTCLVIMNKVEPATETVSAYYCGICDMDCRSELAYTEHVTSRDHQVRMEGHGQLKISCDLCCMTFNSENNHTMHLKSKKHANNLAARQRLLPLETDLEKESVQDLRDKIKRTISPPLENFDKIKVNIATDSEEDHNTRSVVVDIEADEEDAMEMGMPRVTLDKKEKKELERKLKEDEEERGKWAKRREEEYAKKKAEILKASKWDSKTSPTDTRGRGRGQGQNPKTVFKDKYKWVAPNLRGPTEKSDNRERYSKESSKERYSKGDFKDHGSRDKRDGKSDRRDKRDGKSDRREGRRSYDKYASDSEEERVILKKGERRHDKAAEDDEEDDLRNVINKQRGIAKSEDGKSSLVFDYGHQSMENPETGEEKRAGLKGFFGGAFAHLREEQEESYATKTEVKESEKQELGKDMERTLLLELLKRQFPDIRYLTERQGGLELMQKIFGAQGMGGIAAGLGLEGTSSAASVGARSVASDEGSVKSAQFKQDGNLMSLVPEDGAYVEEKKEETTSTPKEKPESRRDRKSYSRSRSRSRDRRRQSRSRSHSRSRSSSSRKRYSSRKRSRSSSRERYSKRSRRTPSPDKRKKEKDEKSSGEKDQSKGSGANKDSLTSQVKAKSKDAKQKVLAKWTVSNWSGGNQEDGGKENNHKTERKKADEKESKGSNRREDKKQKEDPKKESSRKEVVKKEESKKEEPRKTKRKDDSKSDREEEAKKRQRTDSTGDKIFEDASDYEEINVRDAADLKEQFENDYNDVEGKRRSDVGMRKTKHSGHRSASKSSDESEKKADEKRRKKQSYDRYNYEEQDVIEDEEDDARTSLQKDLLANLARVENLGRGFPLGFPPFPMGSGPFMPPLSGPPPTHGLGILPGGGPFPPPGLKRGMGPPEPPELEGPPIPVNPNSALTYIQPSEEHNLPPSRQMGSSATDRALKSLLSQVSALGGGASTISTSSRSALRPVSSLSSEATTGSQKLSSELHRLGEEYADEFETSEEESISRPLKSILKKQSKFSLGQSPDTEQQSSGLPKSAVGAEYVVSTGEQAKYFCQLCDVQFTTMSAKNLHLRGPKHLAMFMKHKSPLIDEMIRQAMGVVGEKGEQGKADVLQEGDKKPGLPKKIKEESVTDYEESRGSPGLLPKRSMASPVTVKKDARERSASPYDDEPRLYVDEKTGRIVQAGVYSPEKAARSTGSREGNRERAGSREEVQVPEEDQQSTSSDVPPKLELGTVPTPDEYDRLSQRAKDVLSREEYAQLPPSTRKLLLMETSDQPAAKEPERAGRSKENDEVAHEQSLATEKRDDRPTDFEQAAPASVIKDYDELSTRAKSLLTREEYERLPARDKEYLSREEYLTREEYDKRNARERSPLPRDDYELAARERERLARDPGLRDSYDRLTDRERLAELDRLAERDRLTMADRDRLALADRDRLALADRDRMTLAERDRLLERDRLVDREKLAQRDYYDRYPLRDELPYSDLRAGPDEYGRERGRLSRDEYNRYLGPLDEDLAQRREQYARQRMREEYGRGLPREGYGRPDERDYRYSRDPWDDRAPPGRDYKPPDWEMRSREMYGDPRAHDIRVVSERGGPGEYGERMNPAREWPRGAEGAQERPQSGAQEPRNAPTSSTDPGRVSDGERRPDETAQKGAENTARYGGTYEARPLADRREVTDTHAYGQQPHRDQYDDGEQRHRGREAGTDTSRQDQYDYGYSDASRRGGPGGSRGHRGRGGGGGVGNRGGQRGHPRNAGNNRGQPRQWKGGQGRY